MIPIEHARLAQLMHKERIRAAETRRPEWMYDTAFSARSRTPSRFIRFLREASAQTLHRLAARLEPKTSRWQAPSSPEASPTQ